jgi:hypothetical protein
MEFTVNFAQRQQETRGQAGVNNQKKGPECFSPVV